MAKLFVSYSRKDSVAARKLIEAFKSIEQEVWVDWESIPPAVDWLEQIFRGIEEADAFIFMVSPDSIASEVCKVELGRAVQNNKRIIPIVLRDVAPKDAPESIRKLNWTFIRETDNFEEGLAKVKTAIELDLDWLEEHRRLQVRALEWHRKKDTSLLLRGRDLRNARHMLTTYTSKDPIPTDLQRKYIEHSRRRETTVTVMWILTAITLMLLTTLSIIAVNRSIEAHFQQKLAIANAEEANINAVYANLNRTRAEENAKLAQDNEKLAIEARDVAQTAQKAAEAQRSIARAQIYQTRTGQLYTSTLLALDSWENSPSDEAEEILRENISLLPFPVTQQSQEGSITVLQLSSDGTTFIAVSNTGIAGKTCVRNVKDGKELFCRDGATVVTDALYVRGGKSIAIGYESGLIEIVNAQTGEVERPIEGTPAIRDLDVGTNSNGVNLAIARDNGKITLLNIDRPKDEGIKFEIGGKKLTAADLSPDGRWYAAGSDSGTLTIWNLSTNKKYNYSHQKGKSILSITFSPSTRYLVSGGEDGYAIGFDLQLGTEVFRLSHSDSVTDITFSSNGSWLATASQDGRARGWNLFTGGEELTMSHEAAIANVEISADGKWIATTGEDNTVRVWSAFSGVEMYQIPLPSPGTKLAFANGDQSLLSGDKNGNIQIWDISLLRSPTKYLTLNDRVSQSKFTASGKTLIAADTNRVWVLNPESLASPKSHLPVEPTRSFTPDDVREVVTSPAAEMYAISTSGNQYIIYDLKAGIQIPVKSDQVASAIAFSDDGSRLILAAVDGTIETWSVKSGKQISTLDTGETLLSVAAGPTGVALGGADKILLLDANAEQKLAEWDAPGENQFLAFNSSGALLASVNSAGQIKIWEQGDPTYTLKYTLVRQQPYSLAFDPQSDSTLAVGAVNNVYIVDALHGTEISRIHHRGNIVDMSFSPDGKTLVTASLKMLQFWDMDALKESKIDDLKTAACSRLISNFSKSEWQVLFGNDQPKALCDNLPIPD